VGRINAGIPGAVARRPCSPILANERGRMTRGIPSLHFTETVGSNFSCFSINFTNGKQYEEAVGVALKASLTGRGHEKFSRMTHHLYLY
jgi:hypothetical protein